MAVLSIWTGILMVVLGVAGYFATAMASPTALIPAAFGGLLIGLGAYAQRSGRRKMAMHIAMTVAVLGILGSFSGFIAMFTWLSGGTVERPAAALTQSLMALFLLAFLALGIRSFIVARRGGDEGPSGGSSGLS